VSEVSVAMATHNGEHFLREQLDSIAAQAKRPTELVISDDASSDSTVSIAEQFAREASFPVRIYVNERRVGVAENFMRAARSCTTELVAFSDQDDVWLEAKLARSVEPFADPEVALAVHGWSVVEAGLHVIETRLPNASVVDGLATPKWGQAPGMAMVFRRALLDVLDWSARPPAHEAGRELLHDEWIYGVARVAGRIAFIGEALCLYRQHELNIEGAPQRDLRRRLGEALTVGRDYYANRATQASAWASLLEAAAPAESASFRRLAAALSARSSVYRARGGYRALMRAARAGVYRSRRREGFGLRGFLRDVLLVSLRRGT